MIPHIHQFESRGGSEDGRIWCETWWMRCHGAGYDGSIEDERERGKEHTFTKVRLKGFDKRPFKFAIHEEEEDGLMGLVITRSHATVIGQVLHSAPYLQAKLWPTFFKLIPLLYQYCLQLPSELQLRRVPSQHWSIVRTNDNEQEWRTFWTLVQGNVFKVYPSPSLTRTPFHYLILINPLHHYNNIIYIKPWLL